MINKEVLRYQLALNLDKDIEDLNKEIKLRAWDLGAYCVERCLDTSSEIDTCYLDELIGRRIKEFTKKEFFKNLDYNDQLLFNRVVSLDPANASWGYGKREIDDQITMWQMHDSVITKPFANSDRAVLTGVIGSLVLENDDEGNIKAASEKIQQSALNKAILVGGLALTAVHGRYHYRGFAEYYVEQDELARVIEIGGSIHGDFRMSSLLKPVKEVKDPLGISRPFGPLLPEKTVFLSHSIEPSIMSNAVFQSVRSFGLETTKEIIQDVLAETEGVESIGGPFADYGMNNGRFELIDLEVKLNLVKEYGFEKFSKQQLEYDGGLIDFLSTEDGLVFSNSSNLEDPDNVIIINDELKRFMTTLIKNHGGRTSSHALRNLLHEFLELKNL